MRVLLLLAALLFGLPSFAASRCDVNVPTQTVDLAQVSIAYQSIGRASDPALLLVMGLGGQLIHWPDEVVVALCQQGFRVIRSTTIAMSGLVHLAPGSGQRQPVRLKCCATSSACPWRRHTR